MQAAPRRSVRLIVSLSVGVLAGCRFDPEPSVTDGPPPIITCASDAECPPDWLCPTRLGRCVRISERDDVGPSLVGAPTLTPALGTVGQFFTLAFTVSEPLGQDPVVTVDLGGGREAAWVALEEQTDRTGLRYAFRYAAVGNEGEGTRLLAIDLVDAAGNAVDNLSAGSLVLDFTRPRVVAASLTPRLAAAGTPVQLELQVSEPLPSAPLVELVHGDGTTHALEPDGPSGVLGYRYRYTPTGQELEGDAAIRATGGDEAGNLLEAPEVATLRLDFSPPTLLRGLVSPQVGRAGQRLLVEVDLSEDLAAGGILAAVDLSGGAGTQAWQEVSRASARLRFEHTVAVGSDGRYRLELRDLTDLAGNRATALVVDEVRSDTVAPQVIAVATDAPVYSAQAGHALVTVTFDVDDALADGSLDVRLGNRPLVCGPFQVTSPRFTCTVAVDGSEPEGVAVVSIRAFDAAGNEGVASALVRLDFTPPTVVPGTTELLVQPRPGCPVPLVTRWGGGATARVNFVLDEPAGEIPLVQTGAPEVLAFEHLSGTTSSFIFAKTLGSSPVAQGARTLWAVVVDAVGNRATRALATTTPLVVDTEVPTLQVDQAAVRFVRSPWGNGAAEDLGGFTLPAGPSFALAPADSLSPQATLPASTFALDDGAPLSLRVWADGNRTALLGAGAPDATGRWPRLRLMDFDATTAWVSGVDGACNESAAVRLENAEWVATPRPPVIGASPHLLRASALVGETLALDPTLSEVPSPAATSGADGLGFSSQTGPRWEERAASALRPPNRTGAALTSDAARGRTVLFGGKSLAGVLLADTWEWDGVTWREVTPPSGSPVPRWNHAMAYDAARGRVVMFGGGDGVGYADERQDLWEWDGQRWAEVTPPSGNPTERQGHRLVYDPVRRHVLLFGGSHRALGIFQDTWAWSEGRWTNVTPLTGNPAARVGHALAFDEARGRVVLFGGQQSSLFLRDTWEWDGARWLATGSPSATPWGGGHAMAFDRQRGRLVLAGGDDDRLWEWAGTDWADVTPAGAYFSIFRSALIVHDAARRRLTLHLQDGSAWTFDGQAMNHLSPSAVKPPARFQHAMAYDSARGRTVVFGGGDTLSSSPLRDTWEWDGLRWLERTPSISYLSPPGRSGASMAYDPIRRRVVLFGGFNGSFRVQDTWEWDGTSWTFVSPTSSSPAARTNAALTWDASRGRVVLFGGEVSSWPSYFAPRDTWEWDGQAWTEVTPDGGVPAGSSTPAMTYDSLRGRAVLWNGVETWERDGSRWRDVTPDAGQPEIRLGHTMTFDDSRGRTLAYAAPPNGQLPFEMWEWDGVRWSSAETRSPPRPTRDQSKMVFDTARQRAVTFGGVLGGSVVQDTWEYEQRVGSRPAVHFAVSAAAASLPPEAITGLRVRAHCAGAAAPSGATLLGWSTGAPALPSASWRPLATNTASATATPPYLSAPPAALLDWSAGSAAEARAYLLGADQTFNFQCRPTGGSGAEPARVALDYIEVRVRYRTQ